MTDGTLDALLDENRERDLARGPGANNHVPMVLIALQRLGAAPDLLRRYAETWRKTPAAGPRQAAVEIGPDTWMAQLGRFDRFASYVRYFETRTKEAPVDAVLRETVPVLARGVAGAAYHGLLRLAYAVEHGERLEIAHSLAYWASVHLPSPAVDPARPAADPMEILEGVVEACASLKVEPVGSIQGRMEQVFGSPAFAGALRPVQIDAAAPMKEIASLLGALFSMTQDFTLLHGFTSAQALRILLPHAGDAAAAVSAYWHSICAVPLTLRRTQPPKAPPAAPDADWGDIAARAVASDMTKIGAFEHRVKLVYSCRAEHAVHGWEHLAPLALRELERPSTFV